MIGVAREGGLWIVTLNRPEKANSLTGAMLERLVEVVSEAREARALILTGTGKVFSAGADLDEMQAGTLRGSPHWDALSSGIAALPGLTVAALNGTLAGGAMGMALACDLRIAVPGAAVFYPVMKRGFLPQAADAGRMAALVGPARMKLVLMAGQRLSAEEALAFGLVDRLVPGEELMATARALTADICAAEERIARGIAAMCKG